MPKIINHPTFKKGMTADQCRLVAKKSHRKFTIPPTNVGENRFGKLIKWHYQDCVLVFAKENFLAPYTVQRVEEPSKLDVISKKAEKLIRTKGGRIKPGTEEYNQVIRKLKDFEAKNEEPKTEIE